MVASEAEGAVVAPLRAFLFHSDIVEGTRFGTFATTDAFVSCVEWSGRHTISLEVGVDESCFYPSPTATYHIITIVARSDF